jgi:Tol biopolymer transport system component
VADDTNIRPDIFLRDRQTGVTERISVDSAEVQSNGTNSAASISPNGLFVSFLSEGNNLAGAGVDTNSRDDVFVRDRVNGTTVRVSVGSGGVQADDDSSLSSISADGNLIAFDSRATNLVAGDTNGLGDIFVHNRPSQTTVRVSVDSAGNQATGSADWDESSSDPAITPDGRFVVFTSASSGLVADDTNAKQDIFLHDRQTGSTVRVNLTSAGAQVTDFYSDRPAITPDARFVVFRSLSAELIANDTNSKIDVFLRDRQAGTTERVSMSMGGGHLIADSFYPSISADAGFITFDNASSGAVPVDTNGIMDVFVYDRGTSAIVGPNDLLVDFGAGAVHQRMNNLSWVKVLNGNPLAIAAGDLDGNGKDEAIVSVGGSGIFARYNNAGSFVRKNTAVAVRLAAGDLDGNGRDELIVDRGSAGLWVFRNNASWAQLRAWVVQGLTVGDFDGNGREDVAVDFGTRGLWVLLNNATWQQLYTGNPVYIAAGDLDGNGKDELIADRGTGTAGGIWVRANHAGAWRKIRNGAVTQGLETGDLDGNGKEELLVDLGATGFYALLNNTTTWLRLNTSSPVFFTTADLDSSGKADVVASFGTSGLYVRYNNTTVWTRISTAQTQGLAAGGFD